MRTHRALGVLSIALVLGTLASACSADPPSPPSGGNGGAAGTGPTGSGGTDPSPAGSGGRGDSGGQAGAASGRAGSGGAAGTSSGASGSAGVGQADAGQAVSFNQIRTLIPGTCGGALCHTGRQQPSLANDQSLYRTLLDTVVSECGGAHLVVPGNPQGSAIIQLVHRQCTKEGMPFYMPHDCTSNPCLPASQIRTITSWILAGAPGP